VEKYDFCASIANIPSGGNTVVNVSSLINHPTTQRKAGSEKSIISNLKLEISHHISWFLSLE